MTDKDPDTILVSFDTTLIYEKLMIAFHALRNGAHFIATNPDFVCPTPDGGLIDAGAIIAAIEGSTNRTIDAVIGKPSKLVAELLVQRLRAPAEECSAVAGRLSRTVRLRRE